MAAAPTKTLVKVCCIQTMAEARMAAAAGASAVGLVSNMPSGPGVISWPEVARIATGVRVEDLSVATVLLTSATNARDIAMQASATGVDAVQVVDHLAPHELAWLSQALPLAPRVDPSGLFSRPTVGLLPVVHVSGQPQDEAYAGVAGKFADALLLDSGVLQPDAGSPRELGGTGRTHDWATSAAIVRDSPVPVLLAGGLGPDNATAAVGTVRPAGLDVCSKLRHAGSWELDEGKLTAFLRAARQPVHCSGAPSA